MTTELENIRKNIEIKKEAKLQAQEQLNKIMKEQQKYDLQQQGIIWELDQEIKVLEDEENTILSNWKVD